MRFSKIQAVKIVESSKMDPMAALKQSALVKDISPDMLAEFVQTIKVRDNFPASQASYQTQEGTTQKAQRKIARCKRPVHQV